MAITIEPVGDIHLTWGESLVWDDRRQRLYFVDCATRELHWLEGGEPPLHTMALPSLPTGVVPTEDGLLVIALDDGLHLVDPDAGTTELLAAYPEGIGGRANDATADAHGNLVTGTLNLAEAPGSIWWFSGREGWRHLADGIANTNGPLVLDVDGGEPSLVVADTPAATVHAFPYDGAAGTVGPRRPFLDVAAVGGVPDGACLDADGGAWCCVLGAGTVVRTVAPGGPPVQVVDVGVEQPSDVTFGGPDLDRMFVVSIAVPLRGAPVTSPLAGRLLAVDGVGVRGVPERRFRR
jgi:sugar lactone lactonase YvrE